MAVTTVALTYDEEADVAHLRFARWLASDCFDYMALLGRTLGLVILVGSGWSENLNSPIILLSSWCRVAWR